jgi:hypothetical protein
VGRGPEAGLKFNGAVPALPGRENEAMATTRLEQARRDALEEALREAEEEAAEYECNAAACDAAGNTHGGTGDLHGAMACRAVAKRIRALLDEPRPESPSSDTAGKE